MSGKLVDAEGFRDGAWPISKSLWGTNPLRVKRGGLSREGAYYLSRDVEIYMARFGWAVNTEKCLMNMSETLEEQYEQVTELWSKYDEKLKAFRGNVKNDISSLQASASKTAEAIQKMNRAYGEVVIQMTGEEMQRAIANAERLAAALESINRIQSQALTLQIGSGPF
jgi:septal ring factor EnvC (AmiA/AmiB activator)